MNEGTQDAGKRIKATGRPKYIVGPDAHSRRQAISVRERTDPRNPILFGENPKCGIAKLKECYEKNVPLESITVIEASANSSLVKNMLGDIGLGAEAVRADVIADKQRKRKVCDVSDARRLANAYIRGDIGEFVWTPSPEYSEYRDILFACRDAAKETTRT